MPAKNSLKIYAEDSFYHIYNRGVEKRQIFQDGQDYAVFLSYLKTYLLPKNEMELQKSLSDPAINYKEKDKIFKLLRLKNFASEVTLIAYCLMSNHFHFLVKQKSRTAIDQFMSSFCTRYTMFFNKKYSRVGSLYQAVYKAVLVDSEEQLLYLTSYIHRNPLSKRPPQENNISGNLLSQPSSLPEFLGQRQTNWVHPEEILAYFSEKNPDLDYQSFVEQTEDFSLIQNVIID